MLHYTEELRLYEYFSLQAVAGGLGKEAGRLFDKLGEIFLVEHAEADLSETEREEVREIVSEAEYFQYCRIRQYCEMTGIDREISPLTEEIVEIKGKAVCAMKALGLTEDGKQSSASAYRLLVKAANKGCVTALRLLGFIQAEGVFTEKDISSGGKNFSITAKWNNPEGLFYALYYDEAERRRNMARLKIALSSVSQVALIEQAEKRYSIAAEWDAQASLTEKAFKGGLLQRESYAPQYARIIFSEVIADKDKERLLFSTGREMVAEMSDLPLKLSGRKPIVADFTPLDRMPFYREKEQSALKRAMSNADIRTLPVYRPTCFSYRSAFVGNAYLQAVAACFPNAQVERIEVADLTACDLEPTKSNIFIRSCNEHKPNIYILSFKGKVPSSVFDAVKSFLQSDKREKMRLNRPSVCLDLSAILPVCFCDRENEERLAPLCDVIALANVSKDEKESVTQGLIEAKKALYSVPEIVFDGGAAKLVEKLSVDATDALLDKAIRLHRNKGETLTLTKEMTEEYTGVNRCKEHDYGFGGADHENE